MMQLQRVLRVSHHNFRRTHICGVMLERVVALNAPHKVFVCLLIVSGLGIILAQIALAYVHKVEVNHGVDLFLLEYTSDLIDITFFQGKAYAYRVAVIYRHVVVYAAEEGFCLVEIPVCLCHVAEIEIYVGHVYLAQIHLVALLHAALLKQFLEPKEYGQGRRIVFSVIVIVAVVVKEVELQVERH